MYPWTLTGAQLRLRGAFNNGPTNRLGAQPLAFGICGGPVLNVQSCMKFTEILKRQKERISYVNHKIMHIK